MTNNFLLVDNVEEFLPTHSVWDTAGGNAELATAVFLRGSILSSYGFIETQINDIALASSYLPELAKWGTRTPKTLRQRLEFFEFAFSESAKLLAHQNQAYRISNFMRVSQEERNLWAHGKLVVKPGQRDSRWSQAWITIQNWSPKNGKFDGRRKRIKSTELIELARDVRIWANASHELHMEVMPILPNMSES